MQLVDDVPARETSAAPTHPLRVFLVEDSALIRACLTESISSLANVGVVGHADTEAGAIAALQRMPCDVVLLDLQLREGHGFSVLKALRAPSAGARLTVIVLTNFTSSQYHSRSMELGADYFFDKSREYDRVCDILENLALRCGPTAA